MTLTPVIRVGLGDHHHVDGVDGVEGCLAGFSGVVADLPAVAVPGEPLAAGRYPSEPVAVAGGEDGGIYGATLGAGAAVGGALFNGATRSAVRQLGSAVSDTGANWLRMASNAAPNVGASVGGGLSRLGGLAAGGVGSQTHTKPRGHTQTDRVSQLLHLDPQGLGQYQQVLAQAQQEGRLQQEVNKLAEVDADFRRMLSQ